MYKFTKIAKNARKQLTMRKENNQETKMLDKQKLPACTMSS